MRTIIEKCIFRPLILGAFLSFLLPAVSWAGTIVVGGTGAALGTIRILADAYERDNPGVDIEVLASLGSRGGIRGVSTGVLDIGLSSRPLKDTESHLGISAAAYAKSPFVFATSSTVANPSLTRKELVKIFGGGQVLWSDGTYIFPILRPEADGDTSLLVESVDGMRAAITKVRAVPGIPVATTDQDAMSWAEKIPGALTTATLTAVLAEGRSLIPVSVGGVAPTTANLTNGTYTMAKTLYFVTRADISRAARGFLRFIRSPAGVEILSRTGNVAVPDAG